METDTFKTITDVIQMVSTYTEWSHDLARRVLDAVQQVAVYDMEIAESMLSRFFPKDMSTQDW